MPQLLKRNYKLIVMIQFNNKLIMKGSIHSLVAFKGGGCSMWKKFKMFFLSRTISLSISARKIWILAQAQALGAGSQEICFRKVRIWSTNKTGLQPVLIFRSKTTLRFNKCFLGETSLAKHLQILFRVWGRKEERTKPPPPLKNNFQCHSLETCLKKGLGK